MKFRLNGKEFDNQKDYRRALKESEDRDNAYALWSDEDDSKLISISETKSISELADHFKRTELGIVSRLEKLVPSYEIQTEFHENGLKENEGLYFLGRLRYLTQWYENGQIKSQGNYINYDSCPHGKITKWYENGHIKSEGNYETIEDIQEEPSTIKVGKWTEWYENGQKKSEGSFYNCWGTDEGKGARLNHCSLSSIHNYEISIVRDDDDDDDDPLFAKIDKWTEWYESGQKKSEGRYKDLYYDGKWTLWHENGQKRFEGIFKDSYQFGKHIKWYENGQKKSEYFYKEMPEDKKDTFNEIYIYIGDDSARQIDVSKYRVGGVLAKHTDWDEDGQIISNMTYKDGNYYHGSFISNNSQWSTQGAYKKGKKEGRWIISTIDKNFPVRLRLTQGSDSEPDFSYEEEINDCYSKREVNFKNNKKNGEETYWSLNGHKSHQYNFKDGLLNGIQISWHENGQIENESHYSKGVQYDKDISWHANGQIFREVNYVKGVQHGKETWWYENGQIDSESHYSKGVEHGKFNSWYENGQKGLEWIYKNGKRNGNYSSWYENGQKQSELIVWSQEELNFSDKTDLTSAVATEWYEDGSIKQKTHYKNDEKHGIFTKWHVNGVMQEEGNFKFGKTDGCWISWNENGKEKTRRHYKNGDEVSEDEDMSF